jgi:hypothetical protein
VGVDVNTEFNRGSAGVVVFIMKKSAKKEKNREKFDMRV